MLEEKDQAQRIFDSTSKTPGSDSWYSKRIFDFERNGVESLGVKTSAGVILYPINYLRGMFINPQLNKVLLYWLDPDERLNSSVYNISQIKIQLRPPKSSNLINEVSNFLKHHKLG